MQVLLFQTHVDDKKHGLEFDKDKISYRHKTFDAVLSKNFRAHLTKVMLMEKMKYPIVLELGDEDYFMKPKSYQKSDGTKGVKNRITILSAQEISQGKFESKSLDDVVDEYEKIYSEALGDADIDED